MYICSVIQKGMLVHQQSTEKLEQVNQWIKVFKTNKVRIIVDGRMELTNDDVTRIMLVTWK